MNWKYPFIIFETVSFSKYSIVSFRDYIFLIIISVKSSWLFKNALKLSTCKASATKVENICKSYVVIIFLSVKSDLQSTLTIEQYCVRAEQYSITFTDKWIKYVEGHDQAHIPSVTKFNEFSLLFVIAFLSANIFFHIPDDSLQLAHVLLVIKLLVEFCNLPFICHLFCFHFSVCQFLSAYLV